MLLSVCPFFHIPKHLQRHTHTNRHTHTDTHRHTPIISSQYNYTTLYNYFPLVSLSLALSICNGDKRPRVTDDLTAGPDNKR